VYPAEIRDRDQCWLELGYCGRFLPVFLDRDRDKPLDPLANPLDLGYSDKVMELASVNPSSISQNP
jgi:hypothetical protein